jgi:hypothetical protein
MSPLELILLSVADRVRRLRLDRVLGEAGRLQSQAEGEGAGRAAGCGGARLAAPRGKGRKLSGISTPRRQTRVWPGPYGEGRLLLAPPIPLGCEGLPPAGNGVCDDGESDGVGWGEGGFLNINGQGIYMYMYISYRYRGGQGAWRISSPPAVGVPVRGQGELSWLLPLVLWDVNCVIALRAA